MRIVFVAELNAYDPRADEMVTLHASTGGQGPVVYGGIPYVPCIAKPPRYSLSLSDNGEPAEPTVEYGSLGLWFSSDLANEHWRGYDFDGYPCTIMWGEYDAPLSTFTRIPAGRTGVINTPNPGQGEIDLSGPESELDKEILTAEYAGNGAAEGAEDHKGVLKPFAVGGVENIEADPVDLTYQVYQYHGYGPTDGVKAVYENALALGDPIRRVNSYEELIGLTAEQLPPGSWAHAPAVGMFRLGAEPTGKITLDVGGALDENGERMETFGKIAPWMLHTIGGIPKAQIDFDSFERLDRDFPHKWGNYINSQDKPDDENEKAVKVVDFLREGANQLGAYIISDEFGVFRVGRNVTAKAPLTIQQYGTTSPVVVNGSISKPSVPKRAYKVRVGGRRCFVTHSEDEISSALKDAIEEVAVGIGKAVTDISKDVNDLRGNFRDYAKEAMEADLIEFYDLDIAYGAGITTALGSLHNQNHIAIQSLNVRVNENGELVAEYQRQLTSRVQTLEGDVAAGFKRVDETIASDRQATTRSIETAIATYKGTVDAAFIAERELNAKENEARASETRALDLRVLGTEGRLGSAEGRINIAEGRIADSSKLILSLEEGIAEVEREIGIRIDNEGLAREGRFNEVVNIVNEKERVLSERITQLSSEIVGYDDSAIRADIQRIDKTEADNNGARAQETSSLRARLDNTNGASYEQNAQVIANHDGTLSAIYTNKVSVIRDGVHYIGGIGIANQNGWVQTAFMTDVLSVYTTNGKQQLFYLDGEGAVLNSLTASKIRVKQGQIDDLLVDTLQVRGGAITANQVITGGDTYVAAGGSSDFLTTGFMTIGDGTYGSGIIDLSFTVDATAYYDAACLLELWVDTGSGYRLDRQIIHGITTDSGDTYSRVYGALKTVVSGAQVRVLGRIISGKYTPRSVDRSMYVRNITMTLMGAKR